MAEQPKFLSLDPAKNGGQLPELPDSIKIAERNRAAEWEVARISVRVPGVVEGTIDFNAPDNTALIQRLGTDYEPDPLGNGFPPDINNYKGLLILCIVPEWHFLLDLPEVRELTHGMGFLQTMQRNMKRLNAALKKKASPAQLAMSKTITVKPSNNTQISTVAQITNQAGKWGGMALPKTHAEYEAIVKRGLPPGVSHYEFMQASAASIKAAQK